MSKKIILASASPRRKELLKKIFPSFRVIPSQVNESLIKGKTPEIIAIKTALAKALTVAVRNKKALVIGADTIVVLGQKILGKPANTRAARRMLLSLRGKAHRVITGLAVIDPAQQRVLTSRVVTKIKVRRFPLEEMEKYLSSGKPLDKAGGYGIQEIEGFFLEKISGDYDNVVGLPIKALRRLLRSNVRD